MTSIDVHDPNRAGWTGLDAGGGLADGETLVTHVALADNTPALRVFRNIVGALHDAVLTADALVVEVADDPRFIILVVGSDRTSIEAFGV